MTAIHVAWDPAYSVDRSAVLTARRRGRAYEVLSAFHFPARTPYPRQAGGLVSHLRDLRRRLIGNLGDLDLGESPAAARQRWHDAQDLSFLVRMDAMNQEPADYYLLPVMDIAAPKLLLCETNGG